MFVAVCWWYSSVQKIWSQADYSTLQEGLNKLNHWFIQNFLELNPVKCKFMVILRKQHPTQPTSMNAPSISDVPLEQVSSFKYLGVVLSENISWNKHVEMVRSKAMKQVGMIYRKFYTHCNTASLQQLYVWFVRSHLKYYAAPVWDPHNTSHINSLERVQKFSLRMCLKSWSESYSNLLQISRLPSLKTRRTFLKIYYLYQVINGNFYFPNAPIAFRNIDNRLRSHNNQLICLPRTKTNAFKSSFFPDVASVGYIRKGE